MIRDKKYYRKPRRTFGEGIEVPCQSIDIRSIIDRISQGLPVNSELKQRVPMPPDGELLDDYETGTEEITDITDALAMQDELQIQIDAQNKAAEEMREKQQQVVDVAPKIAQELNT